MSRARAFLAAVLSVLVVAQAAAAKPEWRPHETIAEGVLAYPDPAIDALGYADVVWGDSVAVRPPGARFGPPQRLGGGWPRVAAMPGGGALVVFARDDELFLAKRLPGGVRYEPAVKIAERADRPSIAVDGKGTIFIAWLDAADNGVHVSMRTAAGLVAPAQRLPGAPQGNSPAGDAPTPIVNLAGAALISPNETGGTPYLRLPGEEFQPIHLPRSYTRATLDGAGNVYLFRDEVLQANPYEARLVWRVRRPDGELGPERMLAFPIVGYSSVAMDEAGRAVYAWSRTRPSGNEYIGDIAYMTKAPGGDFGPVRSVGGQRALFPEVLMNRSGATTVVWNEALPGRYTGEGNLVAVAGGPGLPLSAPQLVSTRGWANERRASINAGGRAIVAFELGCESKTPSINASVFETPRPNGYDPPCQDTHGPRLTASRRARISRRGRIAVKVACSEACTLRAGGRVGSGKVRGVSRKRPVAARKRLTLGLRVSARRAKRLRSTLRGRRRVMLRLETRVRDRFGNLRKVKRRIRVAR